MPISASGWDRIFPFVHRALHLTGHGRPVCPSMCYNMKPTSGSPNACTECTYVSVLFHSPCGFRRGFSHFLPCLPHVDVNRLSADCDTSLRDGLSPDYPTLCAQQVNKHIKRLLSPLNEVESQREEDYSFQRVAALRASLQFV